MITREQMINLKTYKLIILIRTIVDSLEISLRNFKKNPPILIYAMPKVGGTTLHKSLENYISSPIYHIHYLDEKKINNVISDYKRKKQLAPYSIRFGKILHRKIEKNRDLNYNIITLVREPISREISLFFQHGKRLYGNMVNDYGNFKKELVIDFLQKRISYLADNKSNELDWFNNELKNIFKIDVFSYPFDKKSGYTIINNKGVKLLLIRLEDLNRVYLESISLFLDIKASINIKKYKRYNRKLWI